MDNWHGRNINQTDGITCQIQTDKPITFLHKTKNSTPKSRTMPRDKDQAAEFSKRNHHQSGALAVSWAINSRNTKQFQHSTLVQQKPGQQRDQDRFKNIINESNQ